MEKDSSSKRTIFNKGNLLMLYIHIPFCDSKCFYCSFNSYTNLHHTQNRYIDSLIQQFKFEIQRFKISKFSTIFIGGGTPSTLSSQNLEKLFATLSPYITDKTEITIEANPNSASEEWLKTAKKVGINRISFGVQSFDNEKLKFLGRNHSKDMAIQSVKNAFEIGFKNINIDLIYDTAMDSQELLNSDIEIAESLPISHISLYSLTLEENTLFENRKDVKVENLENTEWIIQRVSQKFPQYEISNFGEVSKHNFGYWEGKNYIGLGSGAVGFLNNQRFYPQTDVEKYIQNPLDIRTEDISEDDLKFEKIFLGFRSNVGVSKSILKKSEIENANFLVKKNILIFKNDRFFNSNFLLADEVALQIWTD